jgi:RHS repeat-associated protein
LYPTRDYTVFSGEFDENGQTVFEFDLTGKTITDGILVISSIAVPTQETFYETHSEVGKGWLNTGSWSGKYFMADYYKCVNTDPPECWDGETKIGPFTHYPGTPGYTGYTKWVEDTRTQYVKTSYTQIVNEYPEKTEYNLNNNGWFTITNDLGPGTTSTTIPATSFVQGINTLQFREFNAYPTKFDWILYIDQGATPEEYTTTFTYDNCGNVTSTTDPLSNTTFFGYDSAQLYITSITNALNQTITATHDFNTGLLTSMTDAEGNMTSFEYDVSGRVVRKQHPDSTEIEAIYNDLNNTITVYDELDHSAIRHYDGIGRLIRTDWFLSPTVFLTETYTYNYQNKINTKIDSGGHFFQYEYDSYGRLTKLINPDLTFLQIHYNDTSHIATIFDENQHKKEYHFNWINQLVWVKEFVDSANYYMTQYTYDSLGQLTSFTDANGNTTSYEYDSIFGLTKVVFPNGTAENYSYDAVGNLQQITDAGGTTDFFYDVTYRLSTIQYPDQSPIIFAYDANGNRISMNDSEGSSTYLYDNRNRLISETRSIMGQSYTVDYQYDAASNLTSITYPDQSVITYEYDSLGRIVSIPGYAQFTYNDDSLLASMEYGNGVVTTYEYDSRHRPLNLHAEKNDTDLLSITYQYDGVGNVLQMEYNRRLPDQQWVQSVETFGYDWLNRLVYAQGDYGSISYSYDSVGNRLAKSDLVYTYNNMNELLSISDGTIFTYDEMGNTLTRSNDADTWTYIHDKRKMLVQVEKNQRIIAQYAYDGDGRRIKKNEWMESLQEYETRIYMYSGLDMLYEKNIDTNKEAIYIYGPTEKIAKKTDNLVSYYHKDNLKSTRLVTDELGNPVCDVSYYPFGLAEKTGGDGENLLFSGKETDSTGLYYFGARYYDPQTGRWIERDPNRGDIRRPNSLNRYLYCCNNPLRYIDPEGLAPTARNVNKTQIFWYAISFELAYLSAAFLINWLAIPAVLGGIYWKWLYDTLRENFSVDFALQNGEHVIDIHARGDTPGIDMYIASIVLDKNDGDYKAYVDNESNTELRVFVKNRGSGTLEMHVNGDAGSYTFIIAREGRVDIYVDEEGLDLHVKVYPGATVTFYVPMGQPPPHIYGVKSWIIVYYVPDEEDDDEGEG